LSAAQRVQAAAMSVSSAAFAWQHLVGVHHVEGAVGLVDGVAVAQPELDVAVACRELPGRPQRRLHRLDAHHVADPPRQVDGDRPRPAADVEQPVIRAQMRGEVAGGVLDRPGQVGAQHARGVPVGVGFVAGSHASMVAGVSTSCNDRPEFWESPQMRRALWNGMYCMLLIFTGSPAVDALRIFPSPT
jgi:hypothetical protein